MKVYEYRDDSWYDSPACLCCEGLETLIPCYNLIDTVNWFYTYTCHSIEECYRQALELEGIIEEDSEFDYDDIDLEMVCQMYGINVVINYDNLED